MGHIYCILIIVFIFIIGTLANNSSSSSSQNISSCSPEPSLHICNGTIIIKGGATAAWKNIPCSSTVKSSSTNHSKLNPGMNSPIGLIVGVPLGAALLVAGGFFSWKLKKKCTIKVDKKDKKDPIDMHEITPDSAPLPSAPLDLSHQVSPPQVLLPLRVSTPPQVLPPQVLLPLRVSTPPQVLPQDSLQVSPPLQPPLSLQKDQLDQLGMSEENVRRGVKINKEFKYKAKNRYDFFISYRKKTEKTLAIRLFENLQNREYDSTRNYPKLHCFLDEVSLSGGENFTNDLDNSLKNSSIIIILLSEDAISDYTTITEEKTDNLLHEWEIALDRKRTGQGAIYPLLVDVEDGSTVYKFNTFGVEDYPSVKAKNTTKSVKAIMSELFQYHAYMHVSEQAYLDVDKVINKLREFEEQ